jgi:Fur family peroxide stress response transcriptional regulator
MNETAFILKKKNLKLTPQRLAIFHLLRNSEKHPSAESIYNELKSSNPSMSLATVYKTLISLKKAGLINEINVGEDSFRYDCRVEDHMHLICEKCGKICDQEETETVSMIFDRIAAATGWETHSGRFYIYGMCPECKGESKEK